MKACMAVYDDIAADKPIKFATVPDNMKPWLEWSASQVSKTYFKSLLGVDASQSLLKIKCPVLALHGMEDQEVDCRSNLSVLDKRLDASKHQVVPMEGLNNLFQHCSSGIVGDYALIEETFSPEALHRIIGWIKGL